MTPALPSRSFALCAAFFLAGSTAAAQAPAAHPETSAATARVGLGSGLTVRTADDRFSLSIRVRAQTRVTWRSEEDGSAHDDDSVGFELRRLRLLLTGNFLGPQWRYYVQFGFSNQDTETDLRLPVRDAWIQWTGLRDLSMRLGQGKVPFNRQRVTSSSALAMVDRAVAGSELNLDRDVGFTLFSDDLFGLGRRLGYRLGVFGGDGRNRLATNTGLLYVARLQFSPFGGFDDGPETDLTRDRHLRINLGVAAGYNAESVRARSTTSDTYRLGGFDQRHAEADLMVKWRGFSLLAECLWRTAATSTRQGVDAGGTQVTERARDAWGYFAQVGYAFTSYLDAQVRWGELFPIGEGSPVARSRELGASVGWYPYGHDLKLQADYFRLSTDDLAVGRHQVRVQAQLFF